MRECQIQALVPDVALYSMTNDVEQLQIQAADALERFLNANRFEVGDRESRIAIVGTLENQLFLSTQRKRSPGPTTWTRETLLELVKKAIAGRLHPLAAKRVSISAAQLSRFTTVVKAKLAERAAALLEALCDPFVEPALRKRCLVEMNRATSKSIGSPSPWTRLAQSWPRGGPANYECAPLVTVAWGSRPC